ncbi:MAG: carboxypeptidase regulatory-like domain-containing protein [Myxococcales bacterium]|nr:carboxypeptidase regulatory-like domain-containing protein [Myxococcales bacterium]
MLSLWFALLFSCSRPERKHEVTFDMEAAAWRLQQVLPQSPPRITGAGDISTQAVVAGVMTVYDLDSDETAEFSWSVDVDPETLEIESNRNVILAPGAYRFTLVLSVGTAQQYVGTVDAEIGDGENALQMTIRPVIGATDITAEVASRLGEFRLQYAPSDFDDIADPRIGVSIDDGLETIYQVSRATGRTSAYIGIPSGAHVVALRLYDGSLQIGRSIATQENVVISPGEPLQMDLVALAGETSVSFSRAGGAAAFSVSLPDDVIAESGGISDLEVMASVVGPTNAFQEQVVTIAESSSGDFLGDVVFANMQYGPVTVTLTFADVSEGPRELLGSCVQQIVLGAPAATQACPIELRRRAVIGGRLLGTVGFNVFSANGAPLSGAVVTANGTVLGVTNTGFGARGYLRAHLVPGVYSVVASANGESVSASVAVLPLGINNVDLAMPAAPPTSVTMSFVDAATSQPVTATLSVNIVGRGAQYVRDSNGQPRTSFTVTNGTLAVQLASAAAPSPVNPVELVFVVDGEGIAGTSVTRSITSTAATTLSTRVINEAAPPAGVSLVSDSSSAAGANGAVLATVSVNTPPDATTGAAATVVIPAGTVVTDASGQLLTGVLTTELAYYSPRSEDALLAFPGGLDVTVNGAPGGDTSGGFASAGMVSVEIHDTAGRSAKNFSGEGLEISISIPPGMRHPVTGAPITNGSMIPVWSNDSNTGEWTYEGEAPAVISSSFSGGQQVTATFRAKHLSLWNLDWFFNQCFLSRQILLVDDFLNPIPSNVAATLRFRIAITVNGVVNGYVSNGTANSNGGGFNVLQFYNAPRVNVVNIVTYNSMGAFLATQGFNVNAGNSLCDGTGTLYLVLPL